MIIICYSVLHDKIKIIRPLKKLASFKIKKNHSEELSIPLLEIVATQTLSITAS